MKMRHQFSVSAKYNRDHVYCTACVYFSTVAFERISTQIYALSESRFSSYVQ